MQDVRDAAAREVTVLNFLENMLTDDRRIVSGRCCEVLQNTGS